MLTLKIFNTLSDKKEIFQPIDLECVTMYVCGPTVYARAHLGNARSVVVYDLLYRLLKQIFPKVNYVRNITDIDDKIINSAIEQKVTALEIAERYTRYFHKDMAYLNCLSPSHEPKATEHISDVIELVSKLIEANAAYAVNGNVYFNIKSYPAYGRLSGRKIEDQIAGSRIEQNQEKHNFEDFVLWKKEENDLPAHGAVFNSPWSIGRPGWHIECSAMIYKNFGTDFDIHGGGSDLKFPHHENEIAQMCACHKDAHYAHYWVHNGFLMVNGQKMSKSLHNFITMEDLIEQKIPGHLIRYAMLMVHYRQPLNWKEELLQNAANNLKKIQTALEFTDNQSAEIDQEFQLALLDDMNSPLALNILQLLANKILHIDDNNEKNKLANILLASLTFIGILFPQEIKETKDLELIEQLLAQRKKARENKDFTQSDMIRDQLLAMGVKIEDKSF